MGGIKGITTNPANKLRIIPAARYFEVGHRPTHANATSTPKATKGPAIRASVRSSERQGLSAAFGLFFGSLDAVVTGDTKPSIMRSISARARARE